MRGDDLSYGQVIARCMAVGAVVGVLLLAFACAGTLGYHGGGTTVGVSVAIGGGKAGAARGGKGSAPGMKVLASSVCQITNVALAWLRVPMSVCGAPEPVSVAVEPVDE